MELGEKQEKFMELLPRLLDKARDLGFKVRGGELKRSQIAADFYASKGIGIHNSLHLLGLAIDLLLFRDGQYFTNSEDYRPLGEWWESQSTTEYECCWGGRFKDAKGSPKPDGDHFSISHGGVK